MRRSSRFHKKLKSSSKYSSRNWAFLMSFLEGRPLRSRINFIISLLSSPMKKLREKKKERKCERGEGKN